MNENVPILQCHILDTGYCLAWEHHILQGGRHRRLACHSLAILLRHPAFGWLLWDTGYAQRILEVTRKLPFLLYRYATPLCLKPELAVVEQLVRWKLTPKDIRRVIISHFHADHIAGLLDFPNAEFITSRVAYIDIASRNGLRALSRAYIPDLLPSDFCERATLLESFSGVSLPGLGQTHDLFGDRSLLLVNLPGHARGQIGLLANTERGRILFAADGCWMRLSIRERCPPARITHLFVDDPPAVRNTIYRLHDFAEKCPDVLIVPSHCPEAYSEIVEAYHEGI
jgi:glyoxylase-like metal-dependent hydrolase (beta-lactamase superfamily II)